MSSLSYEEKVARSELVAAAALMVQVEGCTIAHASRVFGVTPSAVWKRINPRRAKQLNRSGSAKRRAWDEAHRAPCSECGKPLHAASARADGTYSGSTKTTVCRDCRTTIDQVRELVEQMWREGMTRLEIGEAMGWTPGSTSARISQLRAAGADLPYRRPDAVQIARRLVAARERKAAG